MNQCIMLRESHKHCLCKRNILYLKNVFTNVQVMRSNSTVRKNCLLYVTMKILMIFLWPWLFKVRFFFFFLLLFCLFQIRCVYWICPGLPVVLRRVWTGEPPLSLFLDLSVEEVFALIELRMVGKGLTFLIFYFFFRMETFFITNR